MATPMFENVTHASTLDLYRLFPEIIRDVYARLEGIHTTMSTLTDQIAAIEAADTIEKQDLLDLKAALDAQNTTFNAQVAALQSQIDGGTKVDLTPLIQDRTDEHNALQALIAAVTSGKVATNPIPTTPVTSTPGDVTTTMTNPDGSTTVTIKSLDGAVRETTTNPNGTVSEVFTSAPSADGSVTSTATASDNSSVETTTNADGSKTVVTTAVDGTASTATVPAPVPAPAPTPAVPLAVPTPEPTATPTTLPVGTDPSAPTVTPGA